jgi:hypothetical protein
MATTGTTNPIDQETLDLQSRINYLQTERATLIDRVSEIDAIIEEIQRLIDLKK